MENYFKVLNAVNCNEHTEKKNGLTYLSWAWAWAEVKKAFPEAFYTIYENANGWCYHTDGRTCWVKTGVTINGIEHIEYLPVMDFRNASIPAEKVTSFDVNKAIQRSLTKACARHGLGLYIYAGEDLPEDIATTPAPVEEAPKKRNRAAKKADEEPVAPAYVAPDPVVYQKIVYAYANGIATKTGGNYRQAFIDNYHPGTEQLAAFDNAVIEYKQNH